MLFLASTAVTPTGLLILVLGIAIYLIPTIIASVLPTVHPGLVFFVNLLFGWTIVGWAVALMMSNRLATRPAASAEPPTQERVGTHPVAEGSLGRAA